MQVEHLYSGFMMYLQEEKPELIRTFGSAGSLFFRPDDHGEMKLGILLSPEYYLEEEADTLLEYWGKYKNALS